MTLIVPSQEPLTVMGSVEPRIWTPPLVELTPETSYGFDVCDFAKDIEHPLLEWQTWLVIHAGEEEVLPDGRVRPRFKRVLVEVARQNGKTEVVVVLTLYWMFEEQKPLVLGTSTNLAYAEESWEKAKDLAFETPYLSQHLPAKKATTEATGKKTLFTADGCRYKVAAANRRGGRSLTVNRFVGDELREHDSWAPYNAAYNAQRAVYDAQAFFITNAGDENSVVLNSLREQALKFIKTGEGDYRLGYFGWTAPDGAEIDDIKALAQANPAGGVLFDLAELQREAQAIKAGGDAEEIAGFKTESMCLTVPKLAPAIDPVSWAACGTDTPLPLEKYRDRLALCLDVSLDQRHATLMGAVHIDGIVHMGPVEEWDSMSALKRELPAVVARVRPRVLGWFPSGPAASVAAELGAPSKRRPGQVWPPRGVVVQEIRGETTQVCMGLDELVTSGHVRHPDDPVVNAHVAQAEKGWRGDAWVFQRKGSDPIDATYASAGAAHLARTLPPPIEKRGIIVVSD